MRFAIALGVAFLLALTFSPTNGQLSYCKGQPNLNPVQDQAPVFVKQVKNGKLYKIGQGDETISLVHVWGTPYEMGFAEGTLLHDQIAEVIPELLVHFDQTVEQAIDKYIGPDLAKYVAEYGLIAALDLTYEATRAWAPSHFFEEMKGIAAAVPSVEYNDLVRIHMLPELVKAGCSIFGAWNTATIGGNLVQLRALDWDMDGPFQKVPVVTIYHPNNGSGHAFANVGWAGWVASITGMSSAQMGMSEKVTDHVFGETTRFGIPFNFLFRDILQFDNDLDAAITRMSNARRTCAIWLGCGDGKRDFHKANLFQYSYGDLVVIDPDTVIPYPSNETRYTHPLIQDTVYWGVRQQCFSAVLQQQWGKITPEATIRNIIPMSQTGNLHAAIYDLSAMNMYVANAKAPGEAGPDNAYQRPFVKFDMKSLFNEQPPRA